MNIFPLTMGMGWTGPGSFRVVLFLLSEAVWFAETNWVWSSREAKFSVVSQFWCGAMGDLPKPPTQPSRPITTSSVNSQADHPETLSLDKLREMLNQDPCEPGLIILTIPPEEHAVVVSSLIRYGWTLHSTHLNVGYGMVLVLIRYPNK